ncbi:PIG-L family deacetylase [Streptomyces antarcticus]|uniref:PIG-L family deacetylase n=1 Tax=Streptomyces antarcticus TaxID=2996458 RepID=UPI002271245D|nr:PIG-L family deacetylase [Streptomyces sp. H34-AA3]MCY0940335.1 PIG-L family deacetylase [Streptomyces sp. H34-AA3]
MYLASRTRLAALLAALAVGATGVTTWAHGRGGAPEPTALGAGLRPSVTEGTVVQVVAHPDDDLFFMNPDLSRSISTGVEVATVYLTSGESDGRNEAHGPHLEDPARPADRAAYAEARQNGIRAAYAEMATGDRTSAWRRTAVPTAGGGSAEVDVLVARPHVSLVWMQLREARSISGDNPDSLRGLWDGGVTALGSQLTSGTPVSAPFSYTKEQAVEAIAGVFARYRPTTIRTQDPTPGRSPGGAFLDHQDHVYGARFVQAAAERYAKSTDAGAGGAGFAGAGFAGAGFAGRPHFSVQNYVSYPNSSLPPTLGPQAAEEKLGYLKTYAWTDHRDWCGSPAGCGDRKTATRPTGAGWNQAIRYSRGDGTSWLTEGVSGRLWAVAVLDGRMAYWSRGGPGTPWQGPRFLPGAGMDTGATAARLPDGRVAVFGTRTTLGATPGEYGRALVYAVQSAPDGPFDPWRSLGTPDTKDIPGTSAISAPAVAVDPAGRLTVYVRDSARTLRARAQATPDGAFGGWQSLGGAGLQGDPVTATDSAGRRHVYAATARSVLAWIQPSPDAPDAPYTPDVSDAPLRGPFPTGLPATTGPLSASPRGDGVGLYFRLPGTGAVGTTLVTADGPGPSFSPVTGAGGEGGYGAVGVAGHLLTGRAAAGTAGLSGGPGGAPSWSESQMLYTGAPAAVAQPDGTAVAAALGLDAGLHVTAAPPAGSGPLGGLPPSSPWHGAVPPPTVAQAARAGSGWQR